MKKILFSFLLAAALLPASAFSAPVTVLPPGVVLGYLLVSFGSVLLVLLAVFRAIPFVFAACSFAARSGLARLRVLPVHGLSVRNVTWAHTLVITRAALDAANTVLAPALDRRRSARRIEEALQAPWRGDS